MITKIGYRVTNETLKREIEENRLTVDPMLLTPFTLVFDTLREALDYIEDELGIRKYSIEKVIVPDAKATLQKEIEELEAQLKQKIEELETL